MYNRGDADGRIYVCCVLREFLHLQFNYFPKILEGYLDPFQECHGFGGHGYL